MKSHYLILALILAGTMATTTATAKQPKEVIIANTPIPVTIQNGDTNGSAQPFCPCFTTDEIEAALAGPATECVDDRVLAEGVTSLTRMDSLNALVNISGRFDESLGYLYGCTLGRILGGGAEVEFVVSFPDIGFKNMAACRLTIINSPSWQGCPPTP